MDWKMAALGMHGTGRLEEQHAMDWKMAALGNGKRKRVKAMDRTCQL